MTPDKEVAEWMKGLGFRSYPKNVWFNPDMKWILSKEQATFFYTAKRRAELRAQIKELAHWADFFTDSSMNALTPSERLGKRIAELEAQLNQTKLVEAKI